jgi:hypothetical protein
MIKSTVPRRTQEVIDNGGTVNKFQTGGQEHMAAELSARDEWGTASLSAEEKKAIVKVALPHAEVQRTARLQQQAEGRTPKAA